MASVFTFRNLGVAARVAARQAGKNRTAGALWRGFKVSASHTGKILHQLWLEVIGSVFLAIAGIGIVSAVREYSKYSAGKENVERFVLSIGFTLLFGWFGVSSFLRVNKKAVRKR